VALALGLPDSAVRTSAFDTTLTDARVVLGADWTKIGALPTDQAPTPSDSGSDNASSSASGDTSTTGGPTNGTKGSTGKSSHKPASTSSSAG